MSDDELKKCRPFIGPGFYPSLSNSEYHGSQGVSSSQLKTLLKRTPAHLLHGLTEEHESSAAMNLGTAVHTLTLEPEKFDTEIAVAPKVDKRTAVGKSEWAAFEELNQGKTIITADQYEKARAMADSVRSNSIARILIDDAIIESSIFWWYKSSDADDDTWFKELAKVRPDGLCKSHPVIFDVKTTTDASYTEFARTIEKYGYDTSAAFYKEGVNQCAELLDLTGRIAYTKFVFIVVESEAPFLCALYEMSEEWMDIGRAKFRRAMHALKRAKESDFPGYPEEVRIIEPPGWASRGFVV